MAVTFNTTDLEFVLQQILMAEAGQPPVSPHLAFGLREVAGTNNNSVPGQGTFGAADEVFPRVTDSFFRTVTVNIDGTIFDPNPGTAGDVMTTTYASTVPGPVFDVNVVDPAPRVISNLIADQTANNPAALEAQAAATPGTGYLYQSQIFVLNPDFDPTLPVDLSNPMFVLGALNPDFDPALPIDLSNLQYLPSNTAIQPPVDAAGNLFIPNVTPDAGLSAPFNSWFTFFGQFFDHGLDLVTKGGSGTVFIPLQPDDPLITVGPDGIAGTGDEVTNPGLQFMVLTRATNLAGADGLIGTADDLHEGTNTTTPFVDQNQTYSSHPSHQVFLRDYITGADGLLHSTGRLLTGADGHSMATWADVKANALKLGLVLTDADVGDVPLLATDAYGNVMLGANGFAQVVVRTSNGADGIAGTSDDTTVLVEGTAAGLNLHDAVALGGTVVGTGHAFLNDISPVQPLDAHYVAGDGRANENIALTAIHDIFHAEHNRQIEAVKAQIQAELDVGDTSFASNWVLAGIDLTVANGVDANGNPVHIIQADEWNGERLFQVAKFSTEIQYQHLVFEEFARKVSPNIHLFGNNDIHLDPAITAEFAHAVYRFGHSMLDETVNRYEIGADGTPVIDPATGQPVLNAIGLIDAFLNPLAFAAHGATATGEIVLGSVNQVANEIDEFVTGALRNNLLGLPLDLAAINLARGRDTGVAPLNLVRNQIFTELNTGGTQDTTLKPYASWDEFGQFLKHAGSLVNFVAAYGTHASIIGADTLLDKRAAALALVANAVIGSATFDQDAYDFMHSLGAYANDINNPLAVHAQWSTGSITGLDTVDLWIGGLAEKQNLFGGLLGSTFNFIFENQMEAIQDGDRLYYLPRIEGLHFGSEIENNTFADLIMRNTGTHHLSANIFMTPEYVVEAGTIDPLDPSTWLRNAVTGNPLVEVLTDDYVDALFGDGLHHAFDTQVHFLGDDNFFGNTMVLGGTEGRDVLIAGQADDDTVYGDGGDDWLDGGNGNDVIFGGAGDDIIRDSAGDDIMHAGTGNDNVDGGLGDDIIFGEDGNDLLRGGNSILGDEISGGIGNDIIFGDEGDDALIGNEGDDWIEGGTGGDGLVGDIGAPTGQVPLYAGNDVLDGGDQGDKMVGFSGDDIMLGLGGFDKFTGLLGFDWGSFENEQHGVSVDMTKREFIPNQLAPAGDAVRDFWIETEAVSGSAFDDVLGGTNVAALLPGAAPFVDTFNELVNVNLIFGLANYFPAGPVAFSDGNIMLGGGGSDFIEGRGGNDIIDGDAYLHVELTRDANGNIFPGSQIVREILYDPSRGDIDTAVFTGVAANYTVTTDANGVTTVTDNVGTDGADTLYNIERLQFADVTTGGTNNVPTGALVVNGTAQVGQVLTADPAAIIDADGIASPFSYQWQYEILAAPGGTTQWVDIAGATGVTFAPTDFYVGNALRVVASFTDGQGFTERLFSAPTAALVFDPAVNHAPTVVTQVAEPGLFDTSALQDQPITLSLPLVTTFTDDQTPAANLIYTATLADGSALETIGLSFATTPDGAGGVTGGVITGTPPAGFFGTFDIRVTAADAQGLAVTDVFTINVLPTDGISTGAAALPIPLVAEPEHTGVQFDRTDLEFVLQQILMAEAGQPPVSPHLAFGLREVAGTNNNSVPGQGTFGAADEVFPRVTDSFFRTVTVNIDGTIFDPNPGTAGDVMTTTYASTVPGPVFDVNVVDPAPRVISNLIADQTANNPAALEAQAAATPGTGYLYQSQIFVLNPDFDPTLPVDLSNPMFVLGALNPDFDPALPIDLSNLQYLPSNTAIQPPVDAAGNLFIPNVTPDAGLSAPFNSWFTFFGQFFDHGLDLVTKGGSGTVFIPLQPDDPLITVGPDGIAGTGDEVTNPGLQFMVLTRATNLAGADGLIGTADDLHEGTNTTTPFVDQNQTYSSHPSHQVFLRDYITGADGLLHSTGRLLTGADGHSMATWADVKANALKLGLVLTDADVGDVPLLATDAYGNVMLGANGFAQVVVRTSNGADGIAGTSDDTTVLVEGTAAGLNLHDAVALGGTVVGTGHAFLNDISPVQPLDAHYVAGDGRANENIALTAIHDIFHAEHNRQIEAVKAQIQAELDVGDTSFASNWVLAGIDLTVANGVDANGNPVHIIQADEWNGERLFQVAKFSTEIQYQHLVFEEFARKVSPNIHLFGNNDIHLDPAITAEFAHAVYRFGHSMLDETVNRYEIGADGTPVIDPATGQPVLNAIGLIDAFLNPLAFAAHGATATGEIVLGSVNQVANEIDEFVTGALRNNLLGLPLDLAAINLARGRDTGVAPLNLVRNQIFTELNTGGTQDTTLKPYASWDEFGQFLKHAGSLVNFVAAYGTHASIIGADTLLDKRAAALALVANAVIGSATFDQDAYDFMHSLGAYANDINNPLAVHAQWSTGSITGLDTVDLWIGGLAEKQNLFGGLLGSTFNFIFENQMEAIQDGDRLYYLPRIEGLHFGSEIENNTFADLIMRNTGTHHLSANIFMTPEYVVEAGTIDPLDPSTWLRNAVTGNPLVEVLTDDYVDALFGDGLHHAFDTQVHFLGDDNFFGNTMVLGGTEGRDVLIAGQADDDTVYGDGGDDWLDGGNGNDVIFGGAGDDIIRDSAGDDIMHAGTGNDNVDGGLGDDIIFGEDGNDLLRGGNSILGDEISGGIGNDIIFGDEGDDALIGNEGDDWIEGGTGGDGLVGDIGAPTGQVPLYAGNDVLDGGDQGDKMVGFSGDDIMLGLGGFDKFTGLLGFDWGSFENEQHGVSVDMTKREFIPNQLAPAGDAVRDFWIETEAVSGSAFDDVLGGTETPNVLGVALPDTFNELVNVNLITGLDRYFPGASTGTPVAFSTGNIMLGGGGNDFIEGRSGDDIIDGDARLHVELTRDANGNIFPGSQIVREILTDQWEMPTFGTVIDPFTGEEVFGVLTAGDIDTAVYADVSAAYQISLVTDADGNILFGSDGNPLLSVTHATPTVGVVNTGTDTLHNIERLQFADGIIDNPFNFLVTDFAAQGTLTIDNATPAVGQILTATAAINDVEGVLVNGVLDAATAGPARIDIPQNELFLQWQYQIVAAPGGTSQWVDIAGATGDTFAPTDFYVGFPLRVVATFIDGLGVKETVFSAPTAILVFDPAVNHAPTVVTQVAEPGLFDTSARQDQAMTLFLPLVTTFTDDQTPAANLIYTATLADGSDLSTVGLTFATTPDGAGGVTGGVITGTPPAGFFGTIDIRVKAADAQGLAVTDVFTINVLPQANHAPVITSDGANATAAVSVAENSTAVTTVTATDADALTTLTFSVAGGSDADKFTINTTTGALSFLTAPDFEAPTDVGANNIYDVVVQVSDGNLSDTQAIAVTVTNVGGVTITGTNAANTVNATTTVTGQPLPTNEEDIISGLGGADSLSGLGGNDTIIGGTGNDLIDGGAGNDVIIYTVGDGVDAVFGGTSPGAGAANTDVDTLNIRGTVGGDTLAVIFNGTVLTGAAGGTIAEIERVNADLLGGSDTLRYGTGTTAAVTVNLAAISASGFALITGIENVTGGSGADVLTGDGLDNALNGGAGNDTLKGGFGNDTLVGGTGVDWVSYAGETDALFISLATGSAQRDSAVAPVEDALVTIENVTGGLGGDSITGNTGSNLLDGGLGTGNDTLDGGSGNDTLIGGDGDDSLVGGVGVDSIDGGAANDDIVAGAGNDALNGGLGDDSFTYTFGDGVDATDGGGGIDTLNIVGTAAANTLTLSWNGSALTAFTGGALAGIELVMADLFDGTDTLSYAGATAAVNVDLAAHTASGFTSILGIERVTGGSGNDTLTADTAAADTLSGGAGNDTLTGTGNDVLIGGAGDDTYFANLGDIITEAAGGGNDTVITSSATFTLAANVENLQLVGAGAYAGTGNASANILSIINSGGGGTVTLNGGGGNDRLVGGAGNDAMTGGTGNDVFVFGAGFGNDAITDFDANPAGGQDLLDVSALGITAATFAASVTITDLGADTLVTIGGNTIHLVGVSGVGANIITQQDFIL